MDGSTWDRIGDQIEGWAPAELLSWAAGYFPRRITFATGFGADGCVLIDLIARHRLPIDLCTLDTGLLFPETYELWRTLERRYGVTIRGIRPVITVGEQDALLGEALWQRTPNECCQIRKVEPLVQALWGYDAWITAIRRDQTPDRAKARPIEWDKRFNLVKVNPLVAWTRKDVWDYIRAHEVPYNPLHDRGYPSIGCHPCTTQVRVGEDERAGRWRGMGKTECGLHTRNRSGVRSASVSARSIPPGPAIIPLAPVHEETQGV